LPRNDTTNVGLQQRDVFDYPTVQRCMVDLDAALFHHFLEPSIADWIGHIPADAPQNHLTFKMATPELDHRAVSLDPSLAIIPRVSVTQNPRQNLELFERGAGNKTNRSLVSFVSLLRG